MLQAPYLTENPIDAGQLEQEIRDTQTGAVVTYQGVVRQDKTDLGEVVALDFEAYRDMAVQECSAIQAEVAEQWPGCAAVLQHRIGRVNAGETHVFVATTSQDRDAAFQACHFVIEQLKTRVPLWKKDIFTDGKSLWSHTRHETMLLSDTAISIPES